ncbi:sensor histidine kinase [Methylomonas sp. 2BW1-5-20]|uniref:sensor histidine kinase n=1 Tax=Methylomonas sp. 2BW1-5-20 TaxID=3376686 RepID=UPI00404E3CBE
MAWVPKVLERDMEIEFEAPPNPVLVTGDETLLRELLCNLSDNAIFYGDSAGYIGVKVELGLEPKLIVEDEGPGILASEVDKIFERFYRIPGCLGDGCGFGLVIVREIADLHAARITVGQGEQGKGVRFDIAFGRQ